MSNTEHSSATPGPGWLDLLVTRRREVAIGLFVVAGLIALLVGWGFLDSGMHRVELKIMGVLLALLPLAAGVWQMSRAPGGDRVSETEHARLMVQFLGASLGLWLTAMSVVLAWSWWSDYFAGGLEQWREHVGRVGLCFGCLVGGLVIIFVSLQASRIDPHSDAIVRRVVFGYNAVLSALLVFIILALINVLSYVRAAPFSILGENSDWTSSSLYSMESSTQNLLKNLPQPVKVYVFRTGYGPMDQDVERLMDNCKVYAPSDRFEVEYLLPEANPRAFNRLYDRYKDKCPNIEPEGLLLVYGTDANERCSFITVQDLGTRGRRQGAFDSFEGEKALADRLGSMLENQKPPRLYFTQGNGELDLNTREVGGGRPTGIGILKERLERDGYTVMPFRFGPGQETLPADADMVIMVRPRTVSPEGVKALRDYLARPGDAKTRGKLVVCLDPIPDANGKMTRTGLEELLKEYQVDAGDAEVLTFRNPISNPAPFAVPVTADPDSRNSLARNLINSDGVPMIFAFGPSRLIQAQAPPGQGAPPGNFHAENFLYAMGKLGGLFWGVYEETDLRDEIALARFNKLNLPANREEHARVEKERLPVGVVVNGTSGAGGSGSDSDPRMAVIGSAFWLQNRYIHEGARLDNYALFTNTIKWMRGRPDIGAPPEPKARKPFTIDQPEVEARLIWTPGPLLLLGIIGLGGGIWMIRRR